MIYLLYTIIGLIALSIIILIILRPKKDKRGKNKSTGTGSDEVYVSNGVRYTRDSSIYAENNINVTTVEGDRILQRGDSYRVDVGNYVAPGHYTLLSTAENAQTFNIRLSGFVREFSHGQTVSLATGDIISPVSNSIILR
ncbi:MAG: hypothetical protein LBE09_02010 [Christensenellaceae bacterium]|jgi:hypothetical protein|nr:hypothetical protein [Christensenellaceae bacterium]